MTSASTVSRVDPAGFDWSASGGPAAALREVVDLSTVEDGTAPLDEATLLALRHGLGSSTLWGAGSDGFAWRHDSALDVVVAPVARRRGLGGELAAAATAEPGPLTAWSHGNSPAAAALAARFGFDRVRDLWVMRRSLSDLPPEPPDLSGGDADGIDVRTFRVGEDEDAFLAVNAEAFAHHPEQGGLTRAGLEERMSEPWFDPDGFFVAVRDGQLVGYHWTKVHEGDPPYGEVYVVGVSPAAQGGGLGRRLTLAGLRHLASRGLGEVILYVEADNAPAVAVYQRLGFTHAPEDTHVQYARR
ncbi:MAG: mycothiol synthase [Nocardioidaceae bacterium]|nr:mycothiol synthase [Nocardioidaceae bacterium]